MSNPLRIEERDLVDVFFENCQPLHNVRVEYMPVATGDSWILITEEQKVVYVQQFAQMNLRQKHL